MKFLRLLLLPILFTTCKKPENLAEGSIYLADKGNYLTLEVRSDSTLQDGLIYKTVLIKINDSLLQKKYSDYKLEIAAPGKCSNGTQTLQVSNGGSNQITAVVNSSITSNCEIKVKVGPYTTAGFVAFNLPQIQPTFYITQKTSNAVADGVSYSELLVITPATKNDGKINNFEVICDKGIFLQGTNSFTQTLASNDTLHIYIKNSTVETASIKVKMNSTVLKEFAIKYLDAWPQSITIEPSQSIIKAARTTTLMLNSKLLRNPGTVSTGQIITYSDSTSVGSIGQFLNSTLTNTNAISQAEFRIRDTTYTGPVYIKAKAKAQAGEISSIIKIIVIP